MELFLRKAWNLAVLTMGRDLEKSLFFSLQLLQGIFSKAAANYIVYGGIKEKHTNPTTAQADYKDRGEAVSSLAALLALAANAPWRCRIPVTVLSVPRWSCRFSVRAGSTRMLVGKITMPEASSGPGGPGEL